MCVLIFSKTLVSNIYHFKKKWMTYNHKCILVFTWSIHYSCQILMKLEFSQHTSKNTHISNFIKKCPVGAELFHADRQTDMTKLIITLHNSVIVFKTPKIKRHLHLFELEPNFGLLVMEYIFQTICCVGRWRNLVATQLDLATGIPSRTFWCHHIAW